MCSEETDHALESEREREKKELWPVFSLFLTLNGFKFIIISDTMVIITILADIVITINNSTHTG